MTHWFEWAGYHTTKFGNSDTDVEINDKDRHRVHRRNGVVIYKKHKCTNARCHAGREDCIAWIRGHGEQCLIEQCRKCGRTTSWSYEGIAPKGWKSPVKTHCPKDMQRKPMYKWEHRNVAKTLWEPTLTKGDVIALIDRISEEYRIPTPAITLSDHSGTSWARHTSHVKIMRNHRSVAVVCHEMAHIIHHHMEAGQEPVITVKEAGHGQTYMATYLIVLEKFTHHKAADLLATCKGLRVRDLDETRTLIEKVVAQDRRARAEEKTKA